MDKRYLEDINDDIKIKLNKKFNEQKNIINKIDLCSAIRKFISRNLSGKSYEYIDKNKKLEIYLINKELWPQNYFDLEDDIYSIFDDLNIKVSQAVKLYDYLGGDESKLKEIINKYKNNEKKLNLINEDYIEKIDDGNITEKEEESESNNSDDSDEANEDEEIQY